MRFYAFLCFFVTAVTVHGRGTELPDVGAGDVDLVFDEFISGRLKATDGFDDSSSETTFFSDFEDFDDVDEQLIEESDVSNEFSDDEIFGFDENRFDRQSDDRYSDDNWEDEEESSYGEEDYEFAGDNERWDRDTHSDSYYEEEEEVYDHDNYSWDDGDNWSWEDEKYEESYVSEDAQDNAWLEDQRRRRRSGRLSRRREHRFRR